jgi:hypothetical protein
VFLKSEHGTTMPARGVESQDSKSSGKNETSFHSTPYLWSFERASGVERKAISEGSNVTCLFSQREKKSMCSVMLSWYVRATP